MTVAADRLRSFVQRIERVEDEIADRKIDLREIYAEAKGEGFSAPIIREVIKRRSKDQQQVREHDELLHLYLAALESDGQTDLEAEIARRRATDLEPEQSQAESRVGLQAVQ